MKTLEGEGVEFSDKIAVQKLVKVGQLESIRGGGVEFSDKIFKCGAVGRH